jgi:hypothetical protein
MLQNFFLIALFALSVIYLVRHLIRQYTNSSSCSGGGCTKCDAAGTEAGKKGAKQVNS